MKVKKDLNKGKDYVEKGKGYLESRKVGIRIQYMMRMEVEVGLKENELERGGRLVEEI